MRRAGSCFPAEHTARRPAPNYHCAPVATCWFHAGRRMVKIPSIRGLHPFPGGRGVHRAGPRIGRLPHPCQRGAGPGLADRNGRPPGNKECTCISASATCWGCARRTIWRAWGCSAPGYQYVDDPTCCAQPAVLADEQRSCRSRDLPGVDRRPSCGSDRIVSPGNGWRVATPQHVVEPCEIGRAMSPWPARDVLLCLAVTFEVPTEDICAPTSAPSERLSVSVKQTLIGRGSTLRPVGRQWSEDPDSTSGPTPTRQAFGALITESPIRLMERFMVFGA